MTEKCPKCGAAIDKQRTWDLRSLRGKGDDPDGYVFFKCYSRIVDGTFRGATEDCLQRQLAQRDVQYGYAVEKFDACRAALAAIMDVFGSDRDGYSQPDNDKRDWHEWLIETAVARAQKAQAENARLKVKVEIALEWITKDLLPYSSAEHWANGLAIATTNRMNAERARKEGG